MPLHLSGCLWPLHRHRRQQQQQQQNEQQQQQEPQDPGQQQQLQLVEAVSLHPTDALVDSEAAHQQQQRTRTEQQQQQPLAHTKNILSSSSSSLPPAEVAAAVAAATAAKESSAQPLATATLTRAATQRSASPQCRESPTAAVASAAGPASAPAAAAAAASPALAAAAANLNREGSLCLSLHAQGSESFCVSPHFQIYLWGLNDCGQLLSVAAGREPKEAEAAAKKPEADAAAAAAAAAGGCPPRLISKLENKTICGCCLGLDRTWLWDGRQSVWGGGLNEFGCIDIDGDKYIKRPRLCEGIRGAVSVAAAACHTIAVLDTGSAIAFGSNEFGQLGRGPSVLSLSHFNPQAMQIDRSIPQLQGQQVRLRQAACGSGYSLLLSDTGMLLGCGLSPFGCLGMGTERAQQVEPLLRPVSALFGLPIKQVAASDEHVLALSISGEVFSWGSNKWGRLGLGEAYDEVKQVSTPQLVRLSLRARAVFASASHSGLLVSGGLLYLCGSNSYGELGFPVGCDPASRSRLPRDSTQSPPVSWSSRFLLVRSLQNHKIKLAALGTHFSMALTRTGRVFTWGLNNLNQLGVSPDTNFSLSPFLGEEGPPPRPYTYEPQPLWLPPGGPPMQQLYFYLIAAGPFTAFAAAVETPQTDSDPTKERDRDRAPSPAIEQLCKKVLCRSRSSVGWEQRKLSASFSLSPQPPSPAAATAAAGAAAAQLPLQRLLTLSRGDSSVVGFEGPGGPLGAADRSLSRQESCSVDLSLFCMSGLSVEEALGYIEGARSTGDSSQLKTVISRVFSDVFRLNSSFVYPGHGSLPDFEGIAAVYKQLPQQLLPLVCHCFSNVITNSIKMAQHLKRPDQVKFILLILACTPVYASFSEGSKGGPQGDPQKGTQEGSDVAPRGNDEPEAMASDTAGNQQQQQQQEQQQLKQRGEMLYTAVLHLLFHLPADGKKSFLRLAMEFPDSLFETALVAPACGFLSLSLSASGSRYRIVDRVWHCVALLQLLYRANCSSNRRVLLQGAADTKIPIDKFQVKEIGTLVDPIKEVGAYVEMAPRATQDKTQRQIAVRLFDLERDVIGSCELQSRWSLFIAHLNLCPLSFKRNVLLVDNVYRQHHTSLQSLLDTKLPFLILRVRRSHLIEDACKLLGSNDPRDLLRPLKVIFEGEEGVDEGGLRREFFSLLTRELFSASRGLFTYHSGVRTLWFKQQEEPLDSQDKREDASTAAAADSEPAAAKPAAAAAADSATSAAEGSPKPEEKAAGAPASSDQDSSSNNRSELIPEGKAKEYWLTGLLASMAVYNDILMPLSLPIVVYKQLQGEDVALEDLGDVFPDELNSFEKLLEIDNEADFNNAFEGMAFCVDVEQGDGRRVQVPLKPDGASIPLTIKNRNEFVNLYAKYLLVDSVKSQFSYFKKGFQLIASPLLSSLTGPELQLLLCGTPELNFEDLKASCRYEGYSPDSPYIKSLWDILFSFDTFQKQNFLKFVSGSERSPAFGLSELRMTIQKNGGEPTERLPTSFTCFCTFLLPEYGTKEKLERLLTIAIEASEGFGLQ